MLLSTLQARYSSFPIAGHRIVIFDVLGNPREAEIQFGGGFPWYNCPFCGTGVYVNRYGSDVPGGAVNCECDNPWCVANPKMPQDAAHEHYRKADEARQERERREHDHAAAMRRIDEENETRRERWRQAYEDCKAHGWCFECYRKTDGRKIVKHRNECPRLNTVRNR